MKKSLTSDVHSKLRCYKCFRDSKYEGLRCLRDRLTGDELLLWTVETFTMFYDKTWAQRSIIPVIGLAPLIISIFTFVYDNYSDIELAFEYYDQAYNPIPHNVSISSNTLCQPLKHIVDTTSKLLLNTTSDSKCIDQKPFLFTTEPNQCTDIQRTPSEYKVAFVTNIVCMALALLVSYVMCVRELLHHSFDYMNQHRWRRHLSEKFFTFIQVMIGGLSVFPIGLILSPFFILYIGKNF